MSTFLEAARVAKIIFITLDLVLLWLFVFSFMRALPFRPKLKPGGGGGEHEKILTLEDELLVERWNAVKEKFEAEVPDVWKLAVIEADKLVDDALKKLGLEGEHMADRLEQLSKEEVKSLPRLWKAHRMRNNMVHTPGFTITKSEAKEIEGDYEAFLKEIKLLQ